MKSIWPTLAKQLTNWRVLSFLILQTSSIIAWFFPNVLSIFILISILTLLFLAYQRHHKTKTYATFVFVTTFGLALHWFSQNPLSQNIFAKPAQYQGHTLALATVRDGRTHLIVDLEKRVEPLPVAVSGRIQLTIGETCLIPPQSTIVFKTGLKVPRSYHDPGVFDYGEYLKENGIYAQGFVAQCRDAEVVTSDPGIFAAFQHKLYRRLQASDLQNGPALAALLLGSRSLGKAEQELIQNSGLSHLFAISGMQFSVMSALVFGLISLITRLFPGIYLKWPRQKISAFATLVFVFCYLGILVPQASILRSGLMIAVFLIAILIDRQKHLMHIILVSMSGLLLWRPWDLFQVSFQLSYLCVFILAAVLPTLSVFFSKRSWFEKTPKPLRWVLGIVGVTWALNILLLPLILFDFGQISVSGFLHNIWAIPLFDFVITPLSLLFIFLFSLHAAFANPVLHLWDRIITGFIQILSWQAPHLNLTWSTITPHLEHVFLFYLALSLWFVFRQKKLAAVALTVLLLHLSFTYYLLKKNFDLHITQIDVGQGDAILVRTPFKTLLIDSGGNPYFDVGQNVVAPFLKYEWVDEIDIAVITHADSDHYQGFTTLLDSVTVKEFWMGDPVQASPSFDELLKKIEEKKIPIRWVRHAMSLPLDHSVVLNVLTPLENETPADNDNDRSLVIQLKQKNLTALFTGDISTKLEKSLVIRYGDKLKSDILKVAHHGSVSSSGDLFLTSVKPKIATIGVALDSQFGHPHPKTIKRLLEQGIQVWRTDLNGMIDVILRGKDLEVEAFVR